MVYAVIFQAGAWRLFRADVEIASFNSFDLAARAGRRAARTMSESFPTELLLQDRFGELRSERFETRFGHRRDLERLGAVSQRETSVPSNTLLNVH